jgi:hypothetical protein
MEIGQRINLLRRREAGRGFSEELRVIHVMNCDMFRGLEEQSVEETGEAVSLDDVRSMARGLQLRQSPMWAWRPRPSD